MNISYVNKLILSNKDVYYTELQVKHLKILYKCLLGEELLHETIFTNIHNILEKITSLSKEEIKNLNVLDYFLLLFEIRCSSIGNLIYVQPTDTKNTKIEIDVYKFTKILNEIKETKLLSTDIFNNIEIFYSLPSASTLLEPIPQNIFYTYFIKEIKINDKYIDFLSLKGIDRNKIIEQLPVKITSHIFKKVSTILKTFNEINLLSTTVGLQEKKLLFDFNIQNLTSVVKLLFGEQLMTLYENIFMLCKVGNFTPEYIENCTPGEYILFVKKLDALMNQKQASEFIPDESFNPINNDLA